MTGGRTDPDSRLPAGERGAGGQSGFESGTGQDWRASSSCTVPQNVR
jgi:hypothetical protein